ncbi:MAG: hypothetical protein JOY71_05515 [Acetobacteraceae bacterium]|nr:hypothetical protein [Acetobacteraceae bacterium]
MIRKEPQTAYFREFPERHALFHYDPALGQYTDLMLVSASWRDIQARGNGILANQARLKVDPFEALHVSVKLLLAGEIKGAELLAFVTALAPTADARRFPIVWVVMMTDGKEMISPLILPPSIEEIENGSWEDPTMTTGSDKTRPKRMRRTLAR